MTSTSTQPAVPLDADRWPDVAVAAGSPARAAVARALFTTAVGPAAAAGPAAGRPAVRRRGPGRPGPGPAPAREFFRRLGAGGLIGFAEAYMAGDWDCADLTGLLTVLAEHVDRPRAARCRRCAAGRAP